MRLVVTRIVSPQECPWLDKHILPGETVTKFTGVTYGCIGPEGVAVTWSEDPEAYPFFELPLDAVAGIGVVIE